MCFITLIEGSVPWDSVQMQRKVCRCAQQAVRGHWFQNNRHQSVECFKRMAEFLGGLVVWYLLIQVYTYYTYIHVAVLSSLEAVKSAMTEIKAR